MEASADGYLFVLVEAGDVAEVGRPIAVITSEAKDTREEILSWLEAQAQVEPPTLTSLQKRAWTQKAEILARRHGLDIATIPSAGDRVVEADVLAYLETRSDAVAPSAPAHKDLADEPYPVGRIERVLVIGGGDGAVQVLDVIAKTPRQRAVAILDDNTGLHGKTVMGIPIIGSISVTHVIDMMERGEFDTAIISISTTISFRKQIFEDLTAKVVPFTNVIHPTVCIGTNVSIGKGNVIMAFCHIGPCAVIGDNNFLSAYVSIEHHNQLGSYCSFGPGVVTSSRVKIGDGVRFGTGVFIEPLVSIGPNSIIGSGCILRRDIPATSVVKSRLNYALRDRHIPT